MKDLYLTLAGLPVLGMGQFPAGEQYRTFRAAAPRAGPGSCKIMFAILANKKTISKEGQ